LTPGETVTTYRSHCSQQIYWLIELERLASSLWWFFCP